MPDPEQVTKGLGDMVRQGLGIFGQGVNTIAQVLKSGDEAVREVDGALTGGTPRPPGPAHAAASDEDVAQQVVSLVRQGRDEAARTGDPRTPRVIARFQDAMRLLFQVPLPGDASGLSDLMPSPVEVVRIALRDLRGSMALVRLANGTGSLADVEEVASFAEDLVGRLQRGVQTAQAVAQEPGVPPEPPSPPASASGKHQGSLRSASRRRHVPSAGSGQALGKAEGKEPANPSAVVFARSMGEVMNDPTVKRWATDMANGKVTEDQFIDRWSRRVGEGKKGNPEGLLAAAKQRAIQNGLAPNDPYLEGM